VNAVAVRIIACPCALGLVTPMAIMVIGQVYSTRSVAAARLTGSRAIPHFGHDPALSACTSGCMGQVYLLGIAGFDAEATGLVAARTLFLISSV